MVAQGLLGAASVVSFVAPIAGPAGFWFKVVALAATAAATVIKTGYDMKGGGQVTLTSAADLIPTKFRTPPTPPVAPQA